jgi:cephalosporin hydroxylase
MGRTRIIKQASMDGGHMQLRDSGKLLWNGMKWAQRFDEIMAFGKLVADEKCQSYLEIGLHRGLTFRFIGMRLPPRSKMVGVDLAPQPEFKTTISGLTGRQKPRVILGDSTDPAIVAQVRALAPFDLVLIDGDHSPRVCTADWENYGPLGRIVAFHDIDANAGPERTTRQRLVVSPEPWGVPSLWADLRQRYRHLEIIDKRYRGAGFGIVWTDGPIDGSGRTAVHGNPDLHQQL